MIDVSMITMNCAAAMRTSAHRRRVVDGAWRTDVVDMMLPSEGIAFGRSSVWVERERGLRRWRVRLCRVASSRDGGDHLVEIEATLDGDGPGAEIGNRAVNTRKVGHRSGDGADAVLARHARYVNRNPRHPGSSQSNDSLG
jgi:hypothetical protein